MNRLRVRRLPHSTAGASGLLLLVAFCPGWLLGGTNTYLFNYTNRAALLADGWSFTGLLPVNGGPGADVPRNTEATNGAVVSYDQVTHPGVLRIPVDSGDLWASYNNSRNTLFRSLPPHWTSARLAFSFWPTQNTQQANLVIYHDDDNYVSMSHNFNGGEKISFAQEFATHASSLNSIPLTTTNLFFRLDRDLYTDNISGFYSLDGTNWVGMGICWAPLSNEQLAIFVGGSPSGFPNADLRRVDIITSDNPPGPVFVVQPQHLVFNAVAGQPCTITQQLHVVARRSDTPVAWNVRSDSVWLNSSVASGVTPGAADISVTSAGLLPGTYQGNISVSAPGATSALASVTLVVNPAVRAQVAAWQGARAGAFTVRIEDSYPTAFDDLNTNGLRAGTYVMWHTVAPAFYTNYYLAGMDLGSHTVDHDCYPIDEPALRYEIENNVTGLLSSSPVPYPQVLSFSWPCGVMTIPQEVVAADYFLSVLGYNFNLLENSTPYDAMNLRSFNSHEHPPYPPADLKTVVDAAIAQGKWFNLVLHSTNNDNGAIAYSAGKDIWAAHSAAIMKYIHQRDRTVITNYQESTGQIAFYCFRLPLDATPKRSFESVLLPSDAVTFQVDLTGISNVYAVTVNGASVTFSNKTVAGRSRAIFNAQVSTNLQNITLRIATNAAPVLPAPPNLTLTSLTSVVVTNRAIDPQGAFQSVTYMLLNAPPGAAIDSNGVITWSPTAALLPGLYTFTTVATDNGAPPLSVTNSFTVTLAVPGLPFRLTASLANGQPVLTWSSVSGQVYYLQFKNTPADTSWMELPPITAGGPSSSATDSVPTPAERLYRVRLGP